WLCALSFMELSQPGVFPHDLAREALVAELRWRNPDWYAELHRRARTHYAARLQTTSGAEQQRVLFDFFFLHRDNPVVRPFFEWQESGSTLPERLSTDDVPRLVAMVECHEGDASARLAAHWLARQPEGVLVFRAADRQPAGFVTLVALHHAKAADIEADPAAGAAWQYLQRHAPLRQGEGATLFRFWMASETYQAVSAIQTLVFGAAAQHYLTASGLAFSFFPCADAEFWAAPLGYADLARLPEADFQVGGRSYAMFGHDWRIVPPLAWLDLLAEREIATAPPSPPPASSTESPSILGQAEFAAAVRAALRSLRREDELRANPLLQSRMVTVRAGSRANDVARLAALQALIKEAAEALRASPRDAKGYRALYYTYFRPAPTQERAAELLEWPFSTFRRHLKAGCDRLAGQLWAREIEGTPN
ncbi:MAG TPA: ATP-binding protein, partial [Chloroflexota bacterium]